jgi:N-acetylglucosamine kinase-like BadF-type ATPase
MPYSLLMRYVLGFDGGGTKTECVLMDETGKVLARARSGASNPFRTGIEAAAAAAMEAAEKAIAASGLSTTDIADVAGAFAGASVGGALGELRSRLKEKFPKAKSVFIATDLSMALAATGEVPSLVVIAGTGSAVIGRNLTGELQRDGGLGPMLGDPGSAYDIGRKAVVSALRAWLSGENSYLGKEILALFGCNWIELQAQIRTDADNIFSKIFPIVSQAANGGDATAQTLLREAAEDLAEMCTRVITALNLRNDSFFLAKTGGVFDRSPFLDDYFDKLVHQVAPRARIGPLPKSIAEFAAQSAVDCLDSPVIDLGHQVERESF